MKLFIPTNEADEAFANRGFAFGPLVIEAYQYHLEAVDSSVFEKTQNLLTKKVKTGTTITSIGNTRVL